MALVVGENSYGSQAESDAYFADTLKSTTWLALSSTIKDACLVEVTRILERRVYAGEKEVSTQDLAFPRTGTSDCQGEALTAEESLEVIKEAQFEYAYAVSQNVALVNAEAVGAVDVKVYKSNSTRVELFRSKKGTRYPRIVLDIIKCLLAGNSVSVITGSYASGTSDESVFVDTSYDKSKGFL